MLEHRIRHILEGDGGWPGRLLRGSLWLPGLAYGEAMRLRRRAYEAGWLRSFPSPLPAIAVGNLTAGGSGKTPFTAMLAGEMAASGLTPGILLRGYRPSPEGESDEALLYRRLLPGAVVEVGADRVASAGRATARGARVLLLDDGFQHLRLRRDLDIVLVDAASPWGGGMTMPCGLLREPRSALSRAGVVALTRSDQCPPAALRALRAEAARLAPSALVLTARHRPHAFFAAAGGGEAPPDMVRGRRVVALSGIARPEAFLRTLRDLGADVVAALEVGDHAAFDPARVAEAAARAGRSGAIVATTEKDMMKKSFAELVDNNAVRDVWVLGVRMEVDDPAALLRVVRAACERGSGAKGSAREAGADASAVSS